MPLPLVLVSPVSVGVLSVRNFCLNSGCALRASFVLLSSHVSKRMMLSAFDCMQYWVRIRRLCVSRIPRQYRRLIARVWLLAFYLEEEVVRNLDIIGRFIFVLIAVLLLSAMLFVGGSWLGLLAFLSFCSRGARVGLLCWVLTGFRGCLPPPPP